MYTRILAAVNEHVNSEISARYALLLAKRAGARMYFCSIAERGLSARDFEAAEEAVKRLFHRAREMDVKADCILKTGDPLEEIKKIVRTEAIDIVFAATRHEDVTRRFYARTVARRLSLGLPCSVALVRVVHLGRIRPKTILVPLKAAIDHIEERAYFTALLAGAVESTIMVFHAPQPIVRFFHGEVDLTPVEWESRLPGDVSRFIEYLNLYAVAHEKKFMPGWTGRNITIEAAAKRHDLIIMGASERSLLGSLVRRNPVEDVLRETTCDLIILKPRLQSV